MRPLQAYATTTVVICLLATAAAAVAPAASAAPWREPVEIAAHEVEQFRLLTLPTLDVALAPNGDATVLYLQQTGSDDQGSAVVELRSRVRRAASTTFEAPKLVTAPPQFNRFGEAHPILEADGDGALTAVWVEHGVVRSAEAVPGGDWSVPVTVVGGRTTAQVHEFEVAPDGSAAMLVELCSIIVDGGNSSSECDLKVGTRSAAGVWGAFSVLESAVCGGIAGADMALNAAGDVVATWAEREACGNAPAGYELYAATGSVGSDAWSATATVGDAGAYVSYFPTAAIGPTGTPTIAWQRWPSSTGGGAVAAATRAGDGTWPTPAILSPLRAGRPSIGSDANGNLTVAWEQSSDDAPGIYAARKPAMGGMWAVAPRIAEADRLTDLVVDPGGESMVMFDRTDDQQGNNQETYTFRNRVWTARASTSGAWGAPEAAANIRARTSVEQALAFRAGEEAFAAFGYITDQRNSRVAASWDAAPEVELDPTEVAFGSQLVGSTSAPRTVTLRNTGRAPLQVSQATLTGPFTSVDGTGDCVGTIPAGGECEVEVAFAPTQAGAANGALTFTDDAAGSPHVVPLSGTGDPGTPAVALDPSSKDFGTVPVGSTGPESTFELRNTGDGPLNVSSATLTGPFEAAAGTSDCVGTIPAGGTCEVGVAFSPTELGAATGELTFADDAAGSPHVVELSGTGGSAGAPAAELDPASAGFGQVTVGQVSADRGLRLTNSGAAPLVVREVTLTGQFRAVDTSTCVRTLAEGESCTVAVRFAPASAGAQTGELRFVDNAPGSPHAIALSGMGVAPAGSGGDGGGSPGGGSPSGGSTGGGPSSGNAGGGGTGNAGGGTAQLINSTLGNLGSARGGSTTDSLLAGNLRHEVTVTGPGIVTDLIPGIISDNGGGLIGQAGGNLIGQAGGNLIGQAGGNLIGQAGGNLTSNKGLGFRGLASGPRATPAQARSVRVRCPGAKRRAKRRCRIVVLARAQKVFTAAGTGTLTLKPTRAGRGILKRHRARNRRLQRRGRRARSARLTYLTASGPTSGPAVFALKPFKLKP